MDLNQFRTFRVATCDLNGQMRGKRLPISDYDTVDQGAIKLPLSALNLDVWGLTSKTVHWCLKRGCGRNSSANGPRPVPMPWLDVPTFFVPMWTYEVDRTPFAGDPRHALARVLDRYATRGWQVWPQPNWNFIWLTTVRKSKPTHQSAKWASLSDGPICHCGSWTVLMPIFQNFTMPANLWGSMHKPPFQRQAWANSK